MDADEIVVTLRRLRNDCDPVLFIKYGGKPGQRDYEECTYDCWREQDVQHELTLKAKPPPTDSSGSPGDGGLKEGPYYVGVWNTPVFGRHDAAFKLKCSLKTKAPPKCWADEEQFARTAVGVIGSSLGELSGNIGAQRDDICSVLAGIKGQLLEEEVRLEAEAEAEYIAARRRDMGIPLDL